MEANPLDYVDDGVYIGNVCAATDLATLQKENITHVLNTCVRCPTRFGPSENITALHLMLRDAPDQDLNGSLEHGLGFICAFFCLLKTTLVLFCFSLSEFVHSAVFRVS